MNDQLHPTQEELHIPTPEQKLKAGLQIPIQEMVDLLTSQRPTKIEISEAEEGEERRDIEAANEQIYYITKIADDVAREQKTKLFPVLSQETGKKKIVIFYIDDSRLSDSNGRVSNEDVKLVCEFTLGTNLSQADRPLGTRKIRRRIEVFFEKQKTVSSMNRLGQQLEEQVIKHNKYQG